MKRPGSPAPRSRRSSGCAAIAPPAATRRHSASSSGATCTRPLCATSSASGSSRPAWRPSSSRSASRSPAPREGGARPGGPPRAWSSSVPALRIDGARVLAYDDYGAGPIVVLVHGSPGTARVWQRVAERLAGRFRVVCPNLPGYGDTTPAAADDAGTSHAAEFLEALAQDLGTPLIVAGHSYGGVVALSMALRGRVAPRALALSQPVAAP